MPPPLNPLPVLRTCVLRPRAMALRPSNAVIGVKRHFANQKDSLPQSEDKSGPNMHQAEHVSEEAAKMAKIQGGEGPDVEGQGTPVQDIMRNETDTLKNAPKVMQKDAKRGDTTTASTTPGGTRSFSTWARRQQDLSLNPEQTGSLDPSMLPTAEQQAQYAAELDASSNVPVENPGHKYPLPTLPLPGNLRKDKRYDAIVDQVTNLMMIDGKKSVAQRNMAVILNVLRTSSPPTYDPRRPLLPGAPPASHLPLNPILYLTLAIDSVAPLLRIRAQKGAAGGGVALQIPVPLGLRQRRRQAFVWILDSALKRKSRGSGRDMFAQKIAEELIAVVEGRSSVWEKRTGVHKLATTARANLNYGSRRKR
ncbi:related to 30S ribosomal S7 [Lecanosticta acicola]|uniref:Small ribosomal subunit protein uS7m n=1 Tax=Lecanosticta acicola TaxID=111012 RepID=A0AAI8Z235_9PEZI|nr:related to 30S ribosomal S7 [Lecanosticta acicola]